MADEVRVSGSLVYDDSESDEVFLQIADVLGDVTTKAYVRGKVSVGTTEEAIPLNGITPGWAVFINRDATNFIELRVATAGAKFAYLRPGMFCILELGAGAQAPYAIADTAACQLEYLIIST